MDLLNSNYTKVILQLFQDRLKAAHIQRRKFHLKKIKHLLNLMLKDLLISIRKNLAKTNSASISVDTNLYQDGHQA